MKRIFNYILTAAAVMFTAASCLSEKAHMPGEPEVEGCYGVYFPAQEASGSHTYDPSMAPEVTFKVARRVSKGSIEVPVILTASEDGIFQKETLKFEDGQTETEMKVSFPDSKNGVEYKMSLSITDPQYASKYLEGATNIDFSVLRVQWMDFLNPETNEPAILTFNEGWWGEVHTAIMKYYEVDGVRYCVASCNEVAEDGSPLGIWGDSIGVTFDFIWDTNKVNEDGYQVIDVKRQYLGFDYADNMASKPEKDAAAGVYFYDWYHFLTTDGGYSGKWGSWENFLKANPGAYAQSYYDGNGGFYFNLKYHVPALGGGFTPDVFDVVAICDGFVRVDYSLSAETDYTEGGVSTVYFKAGRDVAKIKLAAVEGKLTSVKTEELVAAIADGSCADAVEVEGLEYDEDTDLQYAASELSFEKTGQYTAVAVAFDATGKAQSSASVLMDYVAADDETFDVVFEIGVEDTPERYASAGFDIYNSFGYYLWGEDITELRVGVFSTSDVTKKGLDAVVSELRAKKEYLAKEDVLEAVNGVGGYASVITNLKDNTSYTLVAWATNGTKASVQTATYVTEKYPETWHSLGTGLYVDDIIGPLFKEDPCPIECEIEESDETKGKYRLINPYGEAFAYNEPGDWDDTKDWHIVVFANNPERVYIPVQPTGVDWGFGIMSVGSLGGVYLAQGVDADKIAAAGFFGTMEDGVITFPTQGLVVSDDDGMYYANNNGEAVILLPDAYAALKPAPLAAKASVQHSSKVVSAKALSRQNFFERGFSYERALKTVEVKACPASANRKTTDKRSVLVKESYKLN